jgi:uroporphyrinogen decarboxylase
MPDSTYRERFDLSLAHRAVDRPPMDLACTDMTGIEGGPRRLAGALGLTVSEDGPEADESVLHALDTDIRGVGGVLTPRNSQARRVSSTEYVDAWGIGYRWSGHHYEAVGRPLAGATVADLETYPWPNPDQLDPDEIRAITDHARFLYERTEYVVCARHPVLGVMELGCWMCGFDDFLYRMAAEPEFVLQFFEIILRYQERVIDLYYGAIGRYIHFTTSGDDFGTQTGPFLSVRMFDELVAPYMAARISATRRHTDAAFFHHTCGSVRALIPSMVRMGVQILNPIQPRVADMAPEDLKRDFGDSLTFYGGVDTQWLLPTGTPDEVRSETRRLIAVLGDSGGYVLSPAHVLLAEVPDANIVAMYRAWDPAAGD